MLNIQELIDHWEQAIVDPDLAKDPHEAQVVSDTIAFLNSYRQLYTALQTLAGRLPPPAPLD